MDITTKIDQYLNEGIGDTFKKIGNALTGRSEPKGPEYLAMVNKIKEQLQSTFYNNNISLKNDSNTVYVNMIGVPTEVQTKLKPILSQTTTQDRSGKQLRISMIDWTYNSGKISFKIKVN